MKMETIKTRLAKDRPMVSVTLRMPGDVVDDLKRIAPLKGYSGYQSLMRAYVGACLRDDLERFEGSAIAKLIEKLRENGVGDDILTKAAAQIADQQK
jgi:hypothetical protein